MAAQNHVISADSHMTEPATLWVDRLDEKFKDRAPRVIKKEGRSGYVFVAPGVPEFPVAGGFAAGRSGKELKEFLARANQDDGYDGARPSGWDPVERIKDQDIDGVHAEVLYTTLGMTLFGLHDADLQRACFKAYNDWLAEFCSHNPKRLVGAALISLEDIGEGAKELQRVREARTQGSDDLGRAAERQTYTSREYTIRSGKLRKHCEMPLSLHVITGKKPPKSAEDAQKGAEPASRSTRLHELHPRSPAVAHRLLFSAASDALSAVENCQG